MKKTTVQFIFAALLLSSSLFSCQKEATKEEVKPCPTTMQGLAGSYRLTALKYRANSHAAEQDYFIFLDACEKDDVLTLNANGIYDYQDAGTSCTPSGTETGNWSVTNGEVISDGILNGTIRSYDCKTLVFYLDNTIETGDRFIFTMVKH
jgi:hypothetical protein